MFWREVSIQRVIQHSIVCSCRVLDVLSSRPFFHVLKKKENVMLTTAVTTAQEQEHLHLICRYLQLISNKLCDKIPSRKIISRRKLFFWQSNAILLLLISDKVFIQEECNLSNFSSNNF